MTHTFTPEMGAILRKFAEGAKRDKARGKAVNELTEEALREYEALIREQESIQPYPDPS